MRHTETHLVNKEERQRASEEIVGRIVELAKPERIILFGSSARGDARADSDFDLLVIKSGIERRRTLAHAIYRRLSDVHASVDVIVITDEDVRKFRGKVGTVIPIALREGKTVYAA